MGTDAAFDDEFHQLTAWIEQVREQIPGLEPGSLGGRLARADLAQGLQELTAMVFDLADEDRRRLGAPDPASACEEARVLLDVALATVRRGSSEQRHLFVAAADQVEIEAVFGAEVGAEDEVIRLLELAHDPGVVPAEDDDVEYWWSDDDAFEVRRRLAFCLADRWGNEERDGDRDRIVELLTPLVEAGDERANSWVRGCLGLALAARQDDTAAPEFRRRADRRRAIALLQEAFDADSEDVDIRSMVVLELARMRYCEHECSAPDAAEDDLGAIIDLIAPFAEDPGPLGGDAVTMCAGLADDLHEHAPDPVREASMIAWLRRGMEHPGVPEDARCQCHVELGIALVKRAINNAETPSPGAPDPASDRKEALEHFELALTGLAASAGEGPPEELDQRRNRIHRLIFDTLGDEDPMTMPERDLDRLITIGDTVLESVESGDTASRRNVSAILGIALFSRMVRVTTPGAAPFSFAAITSRLRPDSLAETYPAASEDHDRAIDLLQTSLSLHDYEDEQYAMVAGILGTSLLIRFMSRIPEVDRAVLGDCLRWLRRSYDHLIHFADAQFQRSIRGNLITALMWSIWSNPPLADGRERVLSGQPGDASISGFPWAENDDQLLVQLLRSAMADPDEGAWIVVITMVIESRREGDLPDDQTCRDWIRRIEHSLRTDDQLSFFERGLFQMARGMIGMVLVDRGPADAALLRRSLDAVQAAREIFPDGHILRTLLDRMAEEGPTAYARHTADLLDAIMNPAMTLSPEPTPPSSAPLPAEVRSVDPLDLSAASLIGDGSPYPFTEPPLRMLEIINAAAPGLAEDPAGHPIAAAVAAMVRHDRWRRERDGRDLAMAIGLVRAAVAGREPGAVLRDRLDALLAGMLLDRYHLAGDRADLDTAVMMFETLIERIDPTTAHPDVVAVLIRQCTDDGLPSIAQTLKTPPTSGKFLPELFAAAGSAALLVAELDGSSDDRATLLLGRAVEGLPEEHPRFPGAKSEAAWINLLQARRVGDAAAEHYATEAVLAAAAECPADHPHLPTLLLRATAAVELGGDVGADATDSLIRRLETAAERPHRSHYGEVARCRYALAHLLMSRHLCTGDPDDLVQAITALEAARLTFSTSPGDPFAVVLLRTLAHAYRIGASESSERRRQARDTGRSALSAHGHAVLLQSGTRRGLGAARRADVDMLRLVRWCLADGRLTEALDALELGRGLVLQAATVAATVPELLREAGYAELADAWSRFATPADAAVVGEAAAGGPAGEAASVPEDVRRRVLEALTGTTAERRLLSAPRPADVGRALQAVRADALVYLIPGTTEVGGHALIVRAEGTVEQRPLDGLLRASRDTLERYLATLDREARGSMRDASESESESASPSPSPSPSPERDFAVSGQLRADLDELCAWAGRAAMIDLLDHARSWGLGRPPRLVLAPIGTLSVVPWHAALLDPAEALGGGNASERYACHEAVFSYCATSRQLVDAAHRPRLPLDGVSVLIVDPRGSEVMHEEAARIRQDFYPGSTVIGAYTAMSADGVAASGEPAHLPPLASSVEPFLPGRGATSAAVLVANCHAVSGAVATDSRLVLDGSDPTNPDRVVTVDRLMSGAAVRDPSAPGGLFLLANCGSDLSMADRDEAMTITTAVLAAGAATVVGTRWAVVDDVRTMVLMYMIHDHLARGFAPADALCAAQLWMLDPRRVPPPGIADLVAKAGGARWDDPRIWAAFTHHGH